MMATSNVTRITKSQQIMITIRITFSFSIQFDTLENDYKVYERMITAYYRS